MVARQILFNSMPVIRPVKNHSLFEPLGFEEKAIICIPILGVVGLFRVVGNVKNILPNKNIISMSQASSQCCMQMEGFGPHDCYDPLSTQSLSTQSFFFPLRPSTESARRAFASGPDPKGLGSAG